MQKNVDTVPLETRQRTDGAWEVSVDNRETWHGPYKSEEDAMTDALELIEAEVTKLLHNAFSF